MRRVTKTWVVRADDGKTYPRRKRELFTNSIYDQSKFGSETPKSSGHRGKVELQSLGQHSGAIVLNCHSLSSTHECFDFRYGDQPTPF